MSLLSAFSLGRKEKEKLTGHKGIVVWLYGLSGSGKSTLANTTEMLLHSKGVLTKIIDGDAIRNRLNADLGFSMKDRTENIRRSAEVAKLFSENGVVSLCCFVTPTNEMRAHAKKTIGAEDFIEVFLSASLQCCEKRDVKGLYAKARVGEVKNFTGIDSAFEKPSAADLIIDTENNSLEKSAEQLYTYILEKIK